MSDRFIRQSRLIPQGMQEARVLLVGLGMLGSWTAHSLARCVGAVHGWDMDEVSTENLGTQCYSTPDLGINKALALSVQLTDLPFYSHPWEFVTNTSDGVIEPRPSDIGIVGHGPIIVVSAVDSFAGRRMLARWADMHANLFIDTRAHGTIGAVVSFKPEGTALAEYLKDLEGAENNAPEPACGMEGTAFVGMWVAQQVTNTLRRAIIGLPVPPKVVQDVGADNRIPQEVQGVDMR